MTSTSVAVQTRVNSVVEADPTVVMSIAGGTGYTVGSPSSAQTTIKNTNVPTLQVSGSTTVSPGGSATVTVTADQAPLQDTQVDLDRGGERAGGDRLQPRAPGRDPQCRNDLDVGDLQHAFHQRDPTGQVHRGVAHPVADVVQRGVPGLSRDHDKRWQHRCRP